MMQHYAFYLGGAYGMFVLAVVVELALTWRRLREARARPLSQRSHSAQPPSP